MRGGREFALNLLHYVFIDNRLRRLAGNAAGNLRQIAATHIQLVGIEMHIAIGAAEVIHLRDKLVVKLGTPALQIALPCQFYIDEILRHRQRLLHLLALIQIDGKGRRETVDETMRIGIIKAIDPEPLLLGKFQESGVLKDDIALLLSRHDYRTERQQTVFDLAHHILGHQRIALARPDGRCIDDVFGTILCQSIDEHIQRLYLAYHSHLHDVGLHIVHDCLYLSGNNLGRNIEELLDTQGILHGDAGYRRNGITSQFEYRLDIRLHTRATGAVGTCNR